MLKGKKFDAFALSGREPYRLVSVELPPEQANKSGINKTASAICFIFFISFVVR